MALSFCNMLILIFSEIIIKENFFSKTFLTDYFITKYIYKNRNFWKKKVDQSKFLRFFRGGLIFLHQSVSWWKLSLFWKVKSLCFLKNKLRNNRCTFMYRRLFSFFKFTSFYSIFRYIYTMIRKRKIWLFHNIFQWMAWVELHNRFKWFNLVCLREYFMKS